MLSRYGTSGEKRDISLYMKVFRLINGMDDEPKASVETEDEPFEEKGAEVEFAVPENELTAADPMPEEMAKPKEAVPKTNEEQTEETKIPLEDEPQDDSKGLVQEKADIEALEDIDEEIGAEEEPDVIKSVPADDDIQKTPEKQKLASRIFTADILNTIVISSLSLCAALAVFAVVLTIMTLDLKPEKTVYVSDDGMRTAHFTNSDTVGEFLESSGIVLSSGDEMNTEPGAIIKDGMFIAIDRAMTVFVCSKDSVSAHTVSGGTVGDALEEIYEASIPAAVTTPSKDTPVAAGMLITIDEVTTKIITQTETIPYSQVTVRDNTILRGSTEVKQQGVEGKSELTYEVTYINGQEVSRVKISQITSVEPIEHIVHRGVKDPATPKPTAKKTSTPKKTTAKKTTDPDKTFSASKAVLSDDKTTVTVDGKTYKIDYSYEVMATAYTHTGNKTASGKWPKVGMMAVDRSIFPFGTKAYVPGYGIAVAEDVGGFRGDQIDLFMDTYEECINWGRKRGLTIYILE